MRRILKLSIIFLGFFLSQTLIAKSSVDTAFSSFLYQALPPLLNDEEMGIHDPEINHQAHQVWDKVVSQGFSVERNQPDKIVRTIFGQLQANIEQLMLNQLENQPQKSAVWIIHTPLIATPLVTTGDISEGLIAKDILAESTRVKNALSRAAIMREFLKKGGYLIVVFQKDLKSARSKEQLSVYENLKKRYPKQLIEFQLDTSHFEDKQFPINHIGATYLMQMPNNDVFEMTNQGVQINQSQDASWGVWLQMRNQSREAVSARLSTQFQFLFSNGLEAVIAEHAKAQGIAPEKVLSLLKCYQPNNAKNECSQK